MKKIVLTLTVVALLTTQTACFYHHVFRVGPGDAEYFAKDWGWTHHLFGGLITISGTNNLNGLCEHGIAEVEDYVSFVNTIVGVLTGFIWTPSTWKVYCLKEGSQPAPGVYIVPPAHSELTPVEITIHPTPEAVARALWMFPQDVVALEHEQRDLNAVADAK